MRTIVLVCMDVGYKNTTANILINDKYAELG